MPRPRYLVGLLVAVATLCGFAPDDYASPEWKEEIAKGYLPYRKLVYDDFPESKGYGSHLMHTEGFIHYAYKAKWVLVGKTATATVTEVQIRSGLDQNRTWRRAGMAETRVLLEHEQGHLDINELHAYDVRQLKWPSGTGSSGQEALDDLQQKISGMIEDRVEEGKLEQDKYDEETAHGANWARQRQWLASLQKRLRDRHITYWDESQ